MSLIYPETYDFTPEPLPDLPTINEVRLKIAEIVNGANVPLPQRAVAKSVVRFYADQGIHHPNAMAIALAQVEYVQNTWYPPVVEEP